MLPLVCFPNKAEEPQVVILGTGRVSIKAGGVYICEKARSLTGAQWAEKQEKFGKREQGYRKLDLILEDTKLWL